MKHYPRIIFLILLLLLVSSVFAAKVVKLADVFQPNAIAVDNDRIYITENFSVFVYSLKDFSLIKKFGQAGQGPKEFQAYLESLREEEKIFLTPTDSEVIVGSLKKISFFSRDGDYIKEISFNDPMAFAVSPVQENYIGVVMERESFTDWYHLFNLYDSKGNKIKELRKYKKSLHFGSRNSGGMGYVFKEKVKKGPEYAVGYGRIFISGAEGFTIEIYDKNGNPAGTIKQDYLRKEVNADEKKKILEAYKSLHLNWETQKKVVHVPDYYPEFKTFLVADQRLFVQTYKKEGEKTEFFIFDVEGKFLMRDFFPIKYKNYIESYPYTVWGGIVYQLVENEGEDKWELHVFPLEAESKTISAASAPAKTPLKKPLSTTSPKTTATGSSVQPQTLTPQQLLHNLENKKYTGKQIEQLNFSGAPLQLMIEIIKGESGLNFVIESGVTGKVDCDFKKIPWDQLLALILEKNKLGLVLENDVLKIIKK